jgi:hypothetical protein
MNEILLPKLPSSPGPRTDTGIIATSGSFGSSQCSGSQPRSERAQSVTSTSLTVVPVASLIALTRSSEIDPNEKRRCGEIGPLKQVRGARAVATSRMPSSSPPAIERSRERPRERVETAGKAFAPGMSVTVESTRGSLATLRTG